jgi:2-succinyl-5-enolpyruvyl-6-hydroxy-3-cyclohexene-1-carboxylate synthase
LRHARKLSSQIIGHYDLILRSPPHLANLAPAAVIQLGPLPTSKVLRAWLGQLRAPTLIVHDGPENVDPLHRGAHYWRGPLAQLSVADAKPPAPEKAYRERWRQMESAAAGAVAKRLGALETMFEGNAAWLLSRKLPEGTPVFVASSMPVRDCEFFWEAGRGQQLYFNRGANGIDGTASTALGVAHATGRPTVLYTGDLALLHDQNGLLAARELPPGASLTIVCVNNDGGGIFEHLPIAQFNPLFERFFATPQGADFKKFAAFYNFDYHHPKNWNDFKRLLLPLPKSGVRLIELRTNRKRDAAFRASLFKELSDKL